MATPGGIKFDEVAPGFDVFWEGVICQVKQASRRYILGVRLLWGLQQTEGNPHHKCVNQLFVDLCIKIYTQNVKSYTVTFQAYQKNEKQISIIDYPSLSILKSHEILRIIFIYS